MGKIKSQKIKKAVTKAKSVKDIDIIQVTDISTGVADWMLTQVALDEEGEPKPPMVIGPAPFSKPPCESWWVPSKPYKWLGTSDNKEIPKNQIKRNALPGNFTYVLKFSLKNPINRRIDFNLWADNRANIFFNNHPTDPPSTDPDYGDNAFWKAKKTRVIITDHFRKGKNTLKVVVKNDGGPSGMLLIGKLL